MIRGSRSAERSEEGKGYRAEEGSTLRGGEGLTRVGTSTGLLSAMRWCSTRRSCARLVRSAGSNGSEGEMGRGIRVGGPGAAATPRARVVAGLMDPVVLGEGVERASGSPEVEVVEREVGCSRGDGARRRGSRAARTTRGALGGGVGRVQRGELHVLVLLSVGPRGRRVFEWMRPPSSSSSSPRVAAVSPFLAHVGLDQVGCRVHCTAS